MIARAGSHLLVRLTLSLLVWRASALTIQGGLHEEARVPCPPFRNPNISALQERRALGAVFADTRATKAAQLAGPVHLFLLSMPHAGSTALASMIASSPQASLLCGAGARQHKNERCEGVWELIRAGLIRNRESRWNEKEPEDWGAALHVYDRFWNQSMKVHVDKSPPNVAKVHRLVDYFKKSKKRAAFIFLTHASCSPGHQSNHNPDVGVLAGALGKTGSIPTIVVRYEELLQEPYRVAHKILDFLPELESLDPAVQALPQQALDKERDLSVVDYVLSHAPFTGKATTSKYLREVDYAMGY
mmetsp:Transcript_45666/g.106000  ORF Transcript_45666/g.106000 Transcript_45666/m.106000 type:complete len:302 (+) Transcript_45666:97-1002(+)